MIVKLCKCQRCRCPPSVIMDGGRYRLCCDCMSTYWFEPADSRAMVELWNGELAGVRA